MASRRASEQLIVSGRVTVNEVVVREQGFTVDPALDLVLLDGRRLGLQAKRYFLLNKPRGVLCTSRDTHGRRTVLDLFPGISERLFTVGRLDRDSEGLLIVTNNGDLALALTHPRYETRKVYHVLLDRSLDTAMVQRMLKGIESEGEVLKAESVCALGAGKPEYRLVLKEGRKREIRRMITEVGRKVLRLRRVAVGSLQLGDLRPGQWRDLTDEERKMLFRDAGWGTAGAKGRGRDAESGIQNSGGKEEESGDRNLEEEGGWE